MSDPWDDPVDDIQKLRELNRYFRQRLRDRSIQEEIRLGLFYMRQDLDRISSQMEILRRSLEEYAKNCPTDVPKITGEALSDPERV